MDRQTIEDLERDDRDKLVIDIRSKEDFDNSTTRPESKATLVNNTTTVEEEKQFWNVDNEDLFSLALGEGNSNENNHVFDINFDQGQNCITSSNNNSINENQSDEIIFF